MTDSSGEIAWAATYQAGGQIASLRHLGHAPVEQPLRFQGQYCDEETGLHYNRHRYYCPRLGRYLTPAPNRLAAGLNAYQYAVNPTAWVNPLGLSSCPGGMAANRCCKCRIRWPRPWWMRLSRSCHKS